MAVKNVEKTIRDRIVTDLQGIDGTGNYNFSIGNNVIFSKKMLLPEQVNANRAIVMGMQRQEPAQPRWRTAWELPMRYEIWGYAKSSTDPAGECNKLLSDIRVAIAGDEHLGGLVTEMTFESEMEAMDDLGICRIFIIATAVHQS